MFTKNDILAYQEFMEAETGTKISLDEATEWANDFFELMLLLVLPTEQRYSLMASLPEPDLEESPQ